MIRNHFNAYELIQGGPLELDPDFLEHVEYLYRELGEPLRAGAYPIWGGYLRVSLLPHQSVYTPCLFGVVRHRGEVSFYYHMKRHESLGDDAVWFYYHMKRHEILGDDAVWYPRFTTSLMHTAITPLVNPKDIRAARDYMPFMLKHLLAHVRREEEGDPLTPEERDQETWFSAL